MGRFANIDTWDPAVNVTNWLLVVVAGLSVLIRLGTKLWIFQRLTSDDYLIIAALVFCIGQSASISIAIEHGYGYHFATVSSHDFNQVMKSQYSAYILYIASLCLSKLSLCTFIRNLTPVHKDHFQAAILQIVIIALGITGVLGTAFQCHPPRTWDYMHGECINLRAWNYFVSVANIVTDAMIVSQALALIFGIQATWKKKLMFASIFLSRIFVILATIAEMVLLQHRHNSGSSAGQDPDQDTDPDPTYDYCASTIATQVVQCASIVTACWGQLKPFLNQLKSNGLRIRGVEYQSTTWPRGKSHSSKSRSYGASGRHGSGNRGERREQHELVPVAAAGRNLTTVEAEASRAWDADSQSSQVGIIRETRTWVVSGHDGRAHSHQS